MDENRRRRRAADNEALFRSINERIEVLNEAFDSFGYGEWTCECPDVQCIQTIRMTTAEYEAVRAHPARFAVAPSEAHVRPEVEAVVVRSERYWVVEKHGEAADLAAELDERHDR
jgi:hypothetical protein